MVVNLRADGRHGSPNTLPINETPGGKEQHGVDVKGDQPVVHPQPTFIQVDAEQLKAVLGTQEAKAPKGPSLFKRGLLWLGGLAVAGAAAVMLLGGVVGFNPKDGVPLDPGPTPIERVEPAVPADPVLPNNGLPGNQEANPGGQLGGDIITIPGNGVNLKPLDTSPLGRLDLGAAARGETGANNGTGATEVPVETNEGAGPRNTLPSRNSELQTTPDGLPIPELDIQGPKFQPLQGGFQKLDGTGP